MAQEAPERGIAYWMKQVVQESDKARAGLNADPVHDLRVAIRRCRAIAQGFGALDPNPAWTKLRKASKPLFASLGELRDVQVQMEWVERLGTPEDPVRQKLLAHFQTREQQLKNTAAAELAKFDPDQWLTWATTLEERAQTIPVGSEVFQLMAIERLDDAHRLHSVALRNRSKFAMHALRIGIKKFRYIVENFLPEQHEQWKKDLKQIQDLLGDIHDLDVLWDTAKAQHVFVSPDQREHWIQTIRQERAARITQYKAIMAGRKSLWHEWRSQLPQDRDLHSAVLKFFETWSFFRDPDLSHTHRVLQMSLALFDNMVAKKIFRPATLDGVPLRDILIVAVLAHEAGHGSKRKHHKQVPHLMEEMVPPPGWTPLHMKVVGLAARYHVGALPSAEHRRYSELRKFARKVVDLLAGVIRLADSFDHDRRGVIQRIRPATNDGHLLIEAVGYQERTPLAQHIAGARYLLETVCGVPIVVQGVAETSA